MPRKRRRQRLKIPANLPHHGALFGLSPELRAWLERRPRTYTELLRKSAPWWNAVVGILRPGYFDSEDFSRRDLSSSDLRGIIFLDCNFSRSHMPDANFRGAMLDNPDFTGTLLRRARFSGAYIFGGRWERADLSGADFTGAVLRRCCFSGAVGVKLEGATVLGS